MNVESNYLSEIPVKKSAAGSYEWWYFDGEDSKGEFQFVIIFYEGCPFSPDYIKSLEKHPELITSKAESHPAVSISVYKNGKTVFYALSEYSPTEVEFNRGKTSLRIGRNTLEGFVENDQLVYALRLEETLATGEKFSGILRFNSPVSHKNLPLSDNNEPNSNHTWNLVQPRAMIKGVISISQINRHEKPILFEGRGYHDRNIGHEPMSHQFVEWYWGRVHFTDMTLIYYIIQQKDEFIPKAWLIGPDSKKILDVSEDVQIDGFNSNIFFLSSARRITIKFKTRSVLIQKDEVLDSGPFYMRFNSAVQLKSDHEDENQLATGLSEYIKPDRIRKRIFWPFVRMRYRYKTKKPHWVQKSSFFYKWTW